MTRMTEMMARGTTRYFQPEPCPEDRSDRIEARIQQRLAVLVGLVAFGLPVILMLGAWLGGSCFRDSISHFYYAQFLGSIFVGLLVFIGGFLIAYSGEHWLEDVGSFVAGLGAFFVAVFPTSGNGCEGPATFLSRVFVIVEQSQPPQVDPIAGRGFFQLFPNVEHLHSYAAGALFLYLGLYCLVVLRRVIPERHMSDGRMIDTKRRRNICYSICGLIIMGCVTTLGAVALLAGDAFLERWNAFNLTFFVETLALWAFGFAWFAKGRQITSLNDAGVRAD